MLERQGTFSFWESSGRRVNFQDVDQSEETSEENQAGVANNTVPDEAVMQSAPVAIPILENGRTVQDSWPRSFFSATEQSLRHSWESPFVAASVADNRSHGKRSVAEITILDASLPINVQQRTWPYSWKSTFNLLTPSPHNYSIASSQDLRQQRQQEEEPLLDDSLEWSRHTRDSNEGVYLTEAKKLLEQPIDERLVSGTSSLFQTILNGLNILCGVGMLATPYAVAKAGTPSVIFIAILACICIYTGMLLKYSMDMGGPRCLSYPDIGAAAFGPYGQIVIAIVLYGELFSCCVETLILGGDNLNELTNHATFPFIDSLKFWIIITTLILLPFTYIRDLRLLSIVSACGFVFSMSILCFITLFGILKYESLPYISQHNFNIQSIPIALGMYLYCFSGHSVFPNLYTGIRRKEKFFPALLVSFTVVTIVYIATALIGYGTFGPETTQQITLSLHKVCSHCVLSQLAGWLVIISPFCAFPLLLTPVAQGVEELFPQNLSCTAFWAAAVATRTLLVGLALVVALSVPLFAYFASLVGSVFSTNISYVFPCVCFMKLASLRGVKLKVWDRVACMVIPVIGLIVGAGGAYNALKAIHKAL